MKFISGKKLSMTQIWIGDRVMAVTPVTVGPCTVTQVKSKSQDGYEALQIAYGVRKEKNINKPQLGHFKKTGVKPAHVREFRLDDASSFKAGDVISVGTFAVGDRIDVTGTSKGKGFQGVVKRHHFGGFRATHGNKDQERMSGSVGPKGPAHVFKGTRMGGRMGGERVTTKNLEVMAIDEANNILFVKGAVPGGINGYVYVQGDGELKVNLVKAEQPKAEAPVAEAAEEVKAEEAQAEPATEAKAEEPAKAEEAAQAEDTK